MCIALTSASPSRTPLARTHSAICEVMFTNCLRRGISNRSSLRKFFTGSRCGPGQAIGAITVTNTMDHGIM
jgi:hypothetical protein